MRRLQRLALFSMLAMSSYSFAVGKGFYIGVATGPARNGSGDQTVQLNTCPIGKVCGPCGPRCSTCSNCSNESFDFNHTASGKPSSNQWGSRFFLGYMINEYAGIEGGFNFFSGIHYNFTTPPPPAGNQPFQACGEPRVRVRDIDVSGKFVMPMQWFDVYAKAGIAYTYQTISGGLQPPQTKTTNCNPCSATSPCNPTSPCTPNTVQTSTACGDSQYESKFNPIFAIGASYMLNQSWVLDLSYNQLLVGGPAKSVSFVAMGISYHIVDVFCGQFLCDD